MARVLTPRATAAAPIASLARPSYQAEPKYTRAAPIYQTSRLEWRPYTVRSGDTMQLIAEKRQVPLETLLKMNHDVSPDALVEGQRLQIPVGKLSPRDQEILAGIGPWTYRTYPVREGEKLEAIISKRNIKRQEVQDLNEGVDLDLLEAGQLIKLPANRYTVREQEMMSSFAPHEFFSKATHMHTGTAIASAALVLSAIAVWRTTKKDDY